MRKRALLGLVALVSALAAAAGSASAGQIIYTHGHDLWAMNDNGTGQHELLSGSQVGGNIGFSGIGSDFGVGVQPGGTAIAFDASVPAADFKCSTNCPGLYSLIGGKVLRLSDPPGDCSVGLTLCGSEQIDPGVTGNGRVVYYSLLATSTPDCGIYYCGYDGGYQEAYYSRALNGSDSPVAWPTPPAPNGDQAGADPEFSGDLAVDPADPNKIAYGGNYIRGLDVLDGQGCGPGGESNCYPLDVESSSGAYNQPAVDDSFYDNLAFSQNGSLVADFESGNNKGIWVYPSAQSNSAPGAKFSWALADPDNGAGGEFDRVINGLTFVGNSEIVFAANNNLWSIPAGCWSAATSPSATTGNCGTFPAHATQLTHDGTTAAPDNEPAWTSSTSPIPAFDPISKLGLGASSVRSGKPITFNVTLGAPERVSIEVLRYFPASGKGRHRRKAHYSKLGTKVFAGKAGANKLQISKLGGRKLAAAKYEAEVTAGGAVHLLKFTVRS